MGESESRERFQLALGWAERNVPDEHSPFAASAYLSLRLNQRSVTADQVRRRLREQGRTKEQLGA